MRRIYFLLSHPYNYTPRFNEVERGVYWYHLVCLSVCPSVDRIVSALYLQQYSSDPFHMCTSYQATSEGVSRVMRVNACNACKFWRIFKNFNCDFVFFWLGIQYDSMVWVIIRRRGYPQNSGVLVVLVLKLDPVPRIPRELHRLHTQQAAFISDSPNCRTWTINKTSYGH